MTDLREINVEVRYTHIVDKQKPQLDEVVLLVDGACLFHLEQMSDQHWWMGIGSPERQYVHVNLFTRRAIINGNCESEGTVKPQIMLDGKLTEEAKND